MSSTNLDIVILDEWKNVDIQMVHDNFNILNCVNKPRMYKCTLCYQSK